MRVRLTWQEYLGSCGGAGLVVLALFALTYGLYGRLVGLLAAPIFLAGGLIGMAWVDRHIRARFESRTDAIRQVLLRQLDKPRPSDRSSGET